VGILVGQSRLYSRCWPVGDLCEGANVGLSQIGAIVTSLGLSTGPYVDKSIRGSVAGAYSLTGIVVKWASNGRGLWDLIVD
jgi:hypothetical protein